MINGSQSRETSCPDARLTAELVQKIGDCCRRDERVTAAYLFGSGASGRLVAGSDIDVAVLVAADHEAIARRLRRLFRWNALWGDRSI